MTQHLRKTIRTVGFIIGWFFCAVVFGLLNFTVSSQIDYFIAEKMGGVQDIPADGSLFAGGKAFGGIDWTFSSIIGPFLALPRPFGIIVAMLLTGLFAWWIAWNIISGKVRWFGRYNWLILANIAIWLLRFPLPIEYSLFYWTAIKY